MKTAEEVLEQVYPLINCSDTGWNISRNTVIEAMNIHSDQFKPKWISVEERLPEEGQIVDIFTSDEGRQTDVTFENGLFITYPKNIHRLIKHTIMLPIQWVNVSHWMPLLPLPTKP